MGGAVSAANRDKRLAENTIVSLEQAHQHMRIYQHRGNGEIMVLIDEDIVTISGLRHTDWDLMKVNGRQQEYFRKVKIDIEVPAKNANLVPSKESLPPRSPNIAESKIDSHYSNVSSNNMLYGNSSSNTILLTPSGISTPSSIKNVPSGNSTNNNSNGSGVQMSDHDNGSKLSTSSSLPTLAGNGSSSSKHLNAAHNMSNGSMNHNNVNSPIGMSSKQIQNNALPASASTGDLLYADERMKLTLNSLKAAAVSEADTRLMPKLAGSHIAEAKHSPRNPLNSSINSFSSYDATESKHSASTPAQFKSRFADEPLRRQPGERRRFEPRPYFPPAQRALNDRSLDEINSQSQSSWSQSQSHSHSQSFSQFSQSAGGGAKEDGSLPSFHSMGSEKLFSSGRVSASEPVLPSPQSNSNADNANHYLQLFQSLANRQTKCTECGRIFVGFSATDALRDHNAQCAERQIMRQSFDRTNGMLLSDIQELAMLDSYDMARAALPRMTRILDDLGRRFRSYLVQITNMQHMNANFTTARRLQASLLRFLQEVERFIADVHSSLLTLSLDGRMDSSNNNSSIAGSNNINVHNNNGNSGSNSNNNAPGSGENESLATMRVFRYLSALQVLAQRAMQRLQDKMFVMEQCNRAILGLSHFDFLRTVGKGGFGSVYIACRKADRHLAASIASASSAVPSSHLHELLTRSTDPGILTSAGVPMYAIKAMPSTEIRKHHATLQVMREKMVMAQANTYSDFFVRMLCSFTHASYLFLVMEFCPGGDCLTLLSAMRRFPEVVAQHFIAQVCVAVQHMHLHGVVHRDIKPDNVMVTARGHAKLGDFGLAVPYPAAFTSAACALYPMNNANKSAFSSTGAVAGNDRMDQRNISNSSHFTNNAFSQSTSASLAPPQTPRSTIQQALRQQQQHQQSQSSQPASGSHQQPHRNSLQPSSQSLSLSSSSHFQTSYTPQVVAMSGGGSEMEQVLLPSQQDFPFPFPLQFPQWLSGTEDPPANMFNYNHGNNQITNENGETINNNNNNHTNNFTTNDSSNKSSLNSDVLMEEPLLLWSQSTNAPPPMQQQSSSSTHANQLHSFFNQTPNSTQISTKHPVSNALAKGAPFANWIQDPAAIQLQRLCQTQQATVEMLQAHPPAANSEIQSTNASLHVPSTDSSSSLFFGHVNNPGAAPQLHSRVGNYFYSCPEIVVGTEYDHTVDYWAIAVMTFHFVAGVTPFDDKDKKATMDNIVTHNVHWAAVPRGVSTECKQFIEAILCAPVPKLRLGYSSASHVLGHPFFWDIDFANLFEGYGPLYPQVPALPNPGTVSATGNSGALFSQSLPSEDARTILPPILPPVLKSQANSNGHSKSSNPNSSSLSNKIDNNNNNNNNNLLAVHMENMQRLHDINANIHNYMTHAGDNNNGAFLPLFTMLGEDETAVLPDFFEVGVSANAAGGPAAMKNHNNNNMMNNNMVNINNSNNNNNNKNNNQNNNDAVDRDLECYTLYP